ncbi:unnamed protein product [marine sediment metagenome]|uniref:Uncharacterized protein n=1 Tax=marine sediment metagenome TaxID=412755 RepID=X1RZ31_9ZZZZ
MVSQVLVRELVPVPVQVQGLGLVPVLVLEREQVRAPGLGLALHRQASSQLTARIAELTIFSFSLVNSFL